MLHLVLLANIGQLRQPIEMKKSFITFDFSMLGEGYEIRASGFLVPVL